MTKAKEKEKGSIDSEMLIKHGNKIKKQQNFKVKLKNMLKFILIIFKSSGYS